MKNDRVMTALVALAMVLALAVVAVNVFSAPGFGAPVYVPEPDESSLVSSKIPESESCSEKDDVFPLNINTATMEELQLIPDIGPVTAQRIIDFRTGVGTIMSINELTAVDGIGIKTVERLKEYCETE